MSILAYIFIAILWMTIVWLISVLLADRWKILSHNPSFWFAMIGVGVLSPICAQIYTLADFIPILSLETEFQNIAGSVFEKTKTHGVGRILKIIFVAYAFGVGFSIFQFGKRWMKLSQEVKKPPCLRYETSTGKIDVILTDMNIPPCSFGVRHFVILIPSILKTHLNAEQIDLIYAHEAAHISARDPLVMLGLLCIRAFYWPHLCLHDLFKRWQLATELRADTIALSGTSPFLRKTYGQLLVNDLRSNSRGALPCPSASLNLSNYRSAKMRVTNIMNPKIDTGKPKRYKKMIGLGSGVLFLMSVIGISALAGEAVSADQNAQPVQRVAPIMPKGCSANAGKYAAKVKLKFDVSKEGQVEHVRITDSDNICFNSASVSTIKKWKYASNARKLKNVETMIAYIVTD